MKQKIIILLALGLSLMAGAEETWSVGEAEVDGKPLVYKFMNVLPVPALRDQLPWLTVVAWKYDGSNTNGMPPKEVNVLMNKLEDALETIVGRRSLYLAVYSATGNDLKEFVFYIADREKFMKNFNDALQDHAAYPIEISFYEDKTWLDLTQLLEGLVGPENKK